MHRFYAPNFPPSGEAQLSYDEGQHVARVLRLRAGEVVAIFDGAGREALARIASVTSRCVLVEVIEPRDPAPEPRVAVTLAQALLKSDKMDRVIRDAVMLGVASVQPFVSRRTDVPFKAVAEGGRQDRWERTVVASVKQCGRAVVPPVHATKEFGDMLQSTTGDLRLMCVEPANRRDIADMRSLEGQRPSNAIVMVGPEGGWDPQEVANAAATGVTLLSFGGRVLRADAAGAAVVSVLRYIWRDL
ncbi:MAG TPA: RsmE family RNA methyltransferase [Vicinamibacterales bacterium]|nr:RsmE family RNA methyltransferase [Vicinamibacterales bacterium]